MPATLSNSPRDESVQLADHELRKPVAASHAHIDDADVALATIQKLIDKPTGGGKLPAPTLRRDPIWDPFATILASKER